MQPVVYYCYDAYCGWCYGFSPVMKQLAAAYRDKVSFEVLSGGMIPAENPRHIGAMAGYISEAYKRVEELTGIRFGEDYLWHILHPDQSDWFPHSEKASIALCILKEWLPDRQPELVAALQYALHYEGRDLTDDEAYRHLLQQYQLDETAFYQKLHSEEYRDKAHYEFALCRQLQANGFPHVLISAGENKFYLLARGYTDYDTLKQRLDNVLAEIETTAT